MKIFLVIWWFAVVLILFAAQDIAVTGAGTQNKCKFPAIYNFGDSNSDTGGRSAAFGQLPPPNGETFFGEPSGRISDGRLIIDFMAEKLGLPYLSAYLDSIGTNFRHGANFATGGSPILPGNGDSPFHLHLQILQFSQFKSRSIAVYQKLSVNRTIIPPFISSVPRPEEFSKAIYTIDIGQNDLAQGLLRSSIPQARAAIPRMIRKFSQAVHKLYHEGARNFWIHNTGPMGCLPYGVIYYRSSTPQHHLDHNGCVEPLNHMAQDFNMQLRVLVSQLRVQLRHASFTYVDIFSAKYALISSAKKQGFEDPMKYCCGRQHPYLIDCGNTGKDNINGSINYSCRNPSKYVSWDGVHYTEAANLLIAEAILNGSFSDPPLSIFETR